MDEWKLIKKLLEKGPDDEELSETEDVVEEKEEQEPQKDVIKENKLSDRIKRYFSEAGIDINGLENSDDLEELVERVKTNHKMRMKEKEKIDRKLKPEADNPWKEFQKKMEDEGDLVEEKNEEDVKHNPKSFSMTIVAIGKPQKKLMGDSGKPLDDKKWKSESELEDDED